MENECAIEVLPFRSLNELIGRCQQYHFPDQFVFSDLSMGEWKAHQIAMDFARQVGSADPPDQPTNRSPIPVQSPPDEWSLADYVPFADLAGKGIDEEALNHQSLLDNQSRAEDIIERADCRGRPQLFVVIWPLDDGELLSENRSFLSAFNHRVVSSVHSLMLVRFGTGNESDTNALNSLLPFVLYEPTVIDGLILLQSGCYLVPPDQRKPRSAISRLQFDKLAQNYRGDTDIQAYAQFNGNAYFADSRRMREYGWSQFSKGSKELGERFLQKAFRLCSQPIERAIILCQLQGIRIALWHFDEAAAEQVPSRAIPVTIRQFLLIAKGWGAAMKGQMEMAATCLDEARSSYDKSAQKTREYLYLLNIIALLSYKTGNAETALAIELQVKNAIDEEGIRDFRLIYVNRINIARIYKKMACFDMALDYFLRAFETTHGLKQEGDLLYHHLILSDVKSALGLYEDSFYHLVRSALYWLSIRFPECLTRRLHSILGFSPVERPDALSDYFYKKMRAHPYYLSQFEEPKALPAQTPRYVSLRNWKGRPCAAIGCPHFSILVSNKPADTVNSPLGSFVYRILALALPALNTIPVVGTILIPEENQSELDVRPEDLIATATRLKITQIYWNDKRIKPCDNALEHILMGMNPGISEVRTDNGMIVIHFKRYYPPVVLPPHFCKTISILAGGPVSLQHLAVQTSMSPQDILSGPAAELESKRIIRISCDSYENV